MPREGLERDIKKQHGEFEAKKRHCIREQTSTVPLEVQEKNTSLRQIPSFLSNMQEPQTFSQYLLSGAGCMCCDAKLQVLERTFFEDCTLCFQMQIMSSEVKLKRENS